MEFIVPVSHKNGPPDRDLCVYSILLDDLLLSLTLHYKYHAWRLLKHRKILLSAAQLAHSHVLLNDMKTELLRRNALSFRCLSVDTVSYWWTF